MFDPPSGLDDLTHDTTDPWHTITVDGLTLEARVPTPMALGILARATSKHAPPAMRHDMIVQFLHTNLTEDSATRLWEAMLDPASPITEGTLDEVMRTVATLGTARPTRRSSH
ncbi:hypothetical protein [Tomitella gaofuii]|uniref:hypothetical protein n=1 Tax=Tomitella gaofuii TaxID=2760083 RepID=UPI0015F895E3|nr:hypothetical protein [Tomitella gaofuii]